LVELGEHPFEVIPRIGGTTSSTELRRMATQSALWMTLSCRSRADVFVLVVELSVVPDSQASSVQFTHEVDVDTARRVLVADMDTRARRASATSTSNSESTRPTRRPVPRTYGNMEEVIQPRRTVGPPPYHHRLALRRLERSPACAGTSQETTMLAGTAWRRPVDFSHLAGPGMSPTMVSWVVRHPEQSGLIGRRKDPHDRRAALVAVTPAAERLLERIRAKRIHAQSFPVAKHSCGAQELLRVGVLAFDGIAEHLLGRCS
jgi:hypothetical protein